MKLTFFTFNAYDMLSGGEAGETAGGAQLQQILVGEELQRRGHDITFVEYDAEFKTEDSIDNIDIITVPKPSGSVPKRVWRVWKNTVKAIKISEPDICYRRVLDFVIFPLSILSTVSQMSFIYGFAHDDELSDSPHMFSDGIKATRPFLWATRRTLSRTSAVITQNDYQEMTAKKRLSTNVFKIPNCYPIKEVKPLDWRYEPPVVLWVARFEPWKRPDLVIMLADEFPNATFLMAGSGGDQDLFKEIEEKAQSRENIVLLGHIPIAEIDRYFATADIFLNTSEQEGFPNTFLQAWAQGTPVLSYQADPNSIIRNHSVGRIANASESILRDQLQKLLSDRNDRKFKGKTARDYFIENHTVDAVADQYERVIEFVSEDSPGGL